MSDVEIIKSKLIGLPHVRYLNLDNRTDRKDYIENHFKECGVKDYVRISANRYGPHNYDEWKKKLIFDKRCNKISYVSILVNQLQSIVDWYFEDRSETCLILEDDLNFIPSKFWSFDWEYLVKRLPCNWDCVQLHIIGDPIIPMGLSRRVRSSHGATCYMINRSYAKKLIQMHYIDDKFHFYTNYGYGKNWPTYHYQSPDFVPYEIGVTYSFPVFITNSNFGSDCYGGLVNLMAKKSDYVIFNWWKNDSKKYNLEDLFLLDTLKRKELVIPISYTDIETRSAFGHNHHVV
ncbi:MAG: hypothetical protein FJ150_09215 [Euryarchaeota archaeon]|nr:hypothetical protein [Euryarchaeota archaeon]